MINLFYILVLILLGMNKHMDIESIKCRKPNCPNRSKYNFIGNRRPYFCKDHKKKHMVNLIRGQCRYSFFNKCKQDAYMAKFNNTSVKLYCILHSTHKMVNIRVMRCHQCRKRAYFNYLHKHTPISCNNHKNKNMIPCIRSMCQGDRSDKYCKNRALYNDAGHFKPKYCYHHATKGMILLKYTCRIKGCIQLSNYTYHGWYYPKFCKVHADNMDCKIVKAYNRCNFDDCNNKSTHGYQKDEVKVNCKKHAAKDMVNILALEEERREAEERRRTIVFILAAT